MSIHPDYEAVIGLEIHLQLSTESKAYCSDENVFGALPNTKVSPVSIAHPGTLPRVNKKSFEYAVKLALAIGAKITERNEFARKNYFYADLPKGYQITQDTTPIGVRGSILIYPFTDKERVIDITRIHLEEDAGKSIHNQDPFNSLIDLNRAGVPLIEIVSEPDLRSSDEAYEYVTEVRKLVRYLGICDGNMEEGSMRCDANVSVMKRGSKVFGQRTETKNINSIRNIKQAIDFEVKRQIELVDQGKQVAMETRSFDMVKGITTPLRSKEEANDYRYFPEPDIFPVMIDSHYIEQIKLNMDMLPNQVYKILTLEFGLSDYDTSIITANKGIADYYLELVKHTENYKAAANWINGPIKAYLNEQAKDIEHFEISSKTIADIIALIDSNKISFSIAQKELFELLLDNPSEDVLNLVKMNNWLQDDSEEILETLIQQIIEENPDEVARYRSGEDKLQGFLMGKLMKIGKGKVNPKKGINLVQSIKKK